MWNGRQPGAVPKEGVKLSTLSGAAPTSSTMFPPPLLHIFFVFETDSGCSGSDVIRTVCWMFGAISLCSICVGLELTV